MKITDKMRLDWLDQQDYSFFCCLYYMKDVRSGIDAGLRDDTRWTSKLRFK